MDLHQQNPGLIPFSKMVTVGVPIEAITQKLKMHGFEDIVIEAFIYLHQNKYFISMVSFDYSYFPPIYQLSL